VVHAEPPTALFSTLYGTVEGTGGRTSASG
jgi:hypothetical protein